MPPPHHVVVAIVGSRHDVPSRNFAQQITSSFHAVAVTAIFRRVLLPRHT
ncbi:MAG: hypothetical protein WC058_07300 [Phycisphaeraceae bacterium]